MEKRFLENWTERFLNALRERRMLVIIDSSSHGYNAHFKVVISGDVLPFMSCAGFLQELGIPHSRKHKDLFTLPCSGNYSCCILERIGRELEKFCKDFDAEEYSELVQGYIPTI